jgi:hypothetical protein
MASSSSLAVTWEEDALDDGVRPETDTIAVVAVMPALFASLIPSLTPTVAGCRHR